jgi:hypothetical protein
MDQQFLRGYNNLIFLQKKKKVHGHKKFFPQSSIDISKNIQIDTGAKLFFDMMNPNGNGFVDFRMFLRFYRISTVYF